jgi:hypothetical protein
MCFNLSSLFMFKRVVRCDVLECRLNITNQTVDTFPFVLLLFLILLAKKMKVNTFQLFHSFEFQRNWLNCSKQSLKDFIE